MFLHFELRYIHSKFCQLRLILSRSRRPEVFCKKRVLRNFAKFTEKHLCQSLFFNKVAGLNSGTVVSCEFCKISNTTFPLYRVAFWSAP